MLNVPKVTLPLSRKRRRRGIAREEERVVFRRVEIGMVKDIERVSLEPQADALFDGNLLRQTHIEARLERSAERVPAGRPEKRLVDVAPRGIARRHAIGAGSDKLRVKG